MMAYSSLQHREVPYQNKTIDLPYGPTKVYTNTSPSKVLWEGFMDKDISLQRCEVGQFSSMVCSALPFQRHPKIFFILIINCGSLFFEWKCLEIWDLASFVKKKQFLLRKPVFLEQTDSVFALEHKGGSLSRIKKDKSIEKIKELPTLWHSIFQSYQDGFIVGSWQGGHCRIGNGVKRSHQLYNPLSERYHTPKGIPMYYSNRHCYHYSVDRYLQKKDDSAMMRYNQLLFLSKGTAAKFEF